MYYIYMVVAELSHESYFIDYKANTFSN